MKTKRNEKRYILKTKYFVFNIIGFIKIQFRKIIDNFS